MELNKILSDSRWGDMAALINTNFEKIRLELMKLRFASILTFCKGYFSTEARFLAKFPTGKTGEYAFVGTPWPGTVYEWIDTAWVNTGVAPQLGESIFVELLKQHIDNTTIYWDEANEVIKSAGGAASTHTITVGINTADIGKCTVTATGAVVSVTLSDDGSIYTILATSGGTVTVNIVAEEGYRVKILNVDKVSQGAISEYTFERMNAEHTMYVWMEMAVQPNPADFLERSDLPGVFYSSLQAAFDALNMDYPNGLTRNVDIRCVKESITFRRDRSLWLAELNKWNKGTLFTLTIDGGGQLTLDCASLGGLRFSYSDNVVIRDTVFTNVANYIEDGSPEEMSAIMFTGDVDSYSRNLYVDNCTIDGSAKNGGEGRYGLITKYADNVYMCSCRMISFNCIPLKIMDCRMLSLIRNHIEASVSYGLIGHPALCTVSNGTILVSEDNEFTGNTGEYLFYITNVEHIFFRRNHIHDSGGEGIRISGKAQVKELVLESNLFAGLLSQPSISWAYHYILLDCNAKHVSLLNNTGIVNGVCWQQWFFRATAGYHIDTFDSYNNIVASGVASTTPMRGIALGSVGTINSGNNLYQIALKGEGWSVETFFSAEGLNGDTRNLANLQGQGVELGSHLVSTDSNIFQSKGGNAPYKLLDALKGIYPANISYLPSADLEYKAGAASGNTVGCYNLSGVPIDETIPVVGYEGSDMGEDAVFSESLQYTTYAENMLMLAHKTPDRKKFLKISAVGEQHASLILGRYGMLELLPVLDANGEYKSDELYTINVE